MSDSDDPQNEAEGATAPLSAQRRRTARVRAERADRLARTLRANIGRRKQQAQARNEETRDAAGSAADPALGSEDPDKSRT